MAEITHTEWRRDQLSWTAESFHCLLFNSSALYYLQTPTRRYGHAFTPLQFLPISGDRDVSLPPSLEWHVWSSSSGNNCHLVHRSLSSGASLCSGTVGPSPCPILSAELACAISFDYWPLGCVTSAIFGMACVFVIERKYLSCSSQVTLFPCITFWRHSENFFYLVSYCQPSCNLHTCQ